MRNILISLIISNLISLEALAEVANYPKSNFDGKRFLNRFISDISPGFLDYLKMRWNEKTTPWPDRLQISAPEFASRSPFKDRFEVTFIGHSTTILRMGSIVIATDPILSERASPISFLGPKRVRMPAVEFSEWPKIDYVLISHNHYDHMDIPTLKKLHERDKPRFLVGMGNKKLLESEGISGVVEMDWLDRFELDDSNFIQFLDCQHFSGRGLLDRNETLWGSFLINIQSKKVYFAGDTGFSPHFKEHGNHNGEIDLAILPIGAYLPRWFMKPMHINPSESIQAHIDLNAKKSLGVHFGTFQLTTEGIDDPMIDLEKAGSLAGITKKQFIVPEFGETISF